MINIHVAFISAFPVKRMTSLLQRVITLSTQYVVSDTTRYDTRCYFNVRSKADMSQLNIPHGTNNTEKWKTEKLKSKKTDMSEVSVNSPENPCSQSWRRKGRAAVGMICRKERF